MFEILFWIVFILAALLLSLIILIQEGKGGGLAEAFGGMGQETFGTGAAGVNRVTGILDAHLASVSNRLANVSRLLAVIAALFGPMTVITGLFGMNVPLPTLAGRPEYQFWEIIGIMALSSTALFFWFKKSGWW